MYANFQYQVPPQQQQAAAAPATPQQKLAHLQQASAQVQAPTPTKQQTPAKNNTSTPVQQPPSTPTEKPEKKQKKSNKRTAAQAGLPSFSQTSFKHLFAKYNVKKMNKEEEGSVEEKFEFLAQIISIQAAKIRKLEDGMRRVESMLPDFGTFEDATSASTNHANTNDNVKSEDEDDAGDE